MISMALVEITKTTSVNPRYVQSIQCYYSSGHVTVRMRDGVEHNVQPVHNESVWEAYDRVREAMVAEACS